MIDKNIQKYLKKLGEAKAGHDHHWHNSSYDEDKVLISLLSFDKRGIKSIVSSDYWARYPTWSASSNKKYGAAIELTVCKVRASYPKLFNFISKYANGIWQMYILDNAYGKDKVRLSKKYINSEDPRVRLRAVKHISVKKAKNFVNSKDYSIRRAALKRVGFENCYKEILDNNKISKSYHYERWLRSEAVLHASLSDFEYKEELMSNLLEIESAKNNNEWEPYSSVTSAEAILSKMDKKDILFYMNYISMSDKLSSTIRRRLGSEWG
jgi:hypothetical protein